MTGKTAIYAITKTNEALDARQTWESDKGAGGFSADYCNFCTMEVEKTTVLAAMNPSGKSIDIYQPAVDGSGLTLRQANRVNIAYQNLCSFTVAGLPHLLAYDPASGAVDFFEVNGELELKHIYSYCKTYGEVTTGWTTVQAYQYRGMMLLLGYDMNNGKVAIYQLQVTATEPLSLTSVWTDDWAEGWTRFSFFQMGGENFFLKSNIKHKHVFIDHLVDNPAEGSHPVGKNLPLSINMTAVKTFELDGDIHFAAYLAGSGATSLYRIHSDCKGWSDESGFTAVTGGSVVVPFSAGGELFLLVY